MSVKNMLTALGYSATLAPRPPLGEQVSTVVLPGVGAYDCGVDGLRNSGWFDYLREQADHCLIVGICLGMQLLCDGSEEGERPGLGLIPGYFRRLPCHGNRNGDIKIPHMGWNTVVFDKDKALWARQVVDPARFYFVHSYRYEHADDRYVTGVVRYGEEFAAAIQRRQTIGFQFHPEKSHRFGMSLFKAVLNGSGCVSGPARCVSSSDGGQ